MIRSDGVVVCIVNVPAMTSSALLVIKASSTLIVTISPETAVVALVPPANVMAMPLVILVSSAVMVLISLVTEPSTSLSRKPVMTTLFAPPASVTEIVLVPSTQPIEELSSFVVSPSTSAVR